MILVAGATFLIVALVAGQLEPNDGSMAAASPSPSPAPQHSSAPSPSRSIDPRPTLVLIPPARNGTATPRPTMPLVQVPAARYQLVSHPGTPVRVTVAIPDGWSASLNSVALTGETTPDGTTPTLGSISAWRIEELYPFPCRWTTRAIVEPSVLTTAASLAQALSQWWGQDPGKPPNSNVAIAPVATRPTQTTFAGFDAWQLQILVLRGFDFDACDANQLVLWQGGGGMARTAHDPGELHRLWVVEAPGGEPVVIDLTHHADAPPDDIAALEAVLESLTIEPGR